MFPFWDLVIGPVFDAVEARRVVEIGALRGETTVRMLDRLDAEAELHVIDPLPQFDPGEHERAFPGRYHFHRGLSLEVLPHLPPCDVALIDGDHNWYTVINELRALATTAADADALLPVLLLHDVAWPYGRRDLYYAPDTIPEEHRQPHAQRGIKPGDPNTMAAGGLNQDMHNAVREGGEHNGVMTALEDFLAEHDQPTRLLFIPIYFGLAVVAEERRLQAQPALAELLDRLEGRDGAWDLLELAEETRLRAMLFQHNVVSHRERVTAAATDRYLDLLKRSLVDDLYIENELRIDHLLTCTQRGLAPVEGMLRDPLRWMRERHRRIDGAHRTGRFHDDKGPIPSYFAHTTMGRNRLDHLHRCLDELRQGGVEGDYVECATGRGGGGVFLRGYLETWQQRRKQLWVVDPFRASPPDGAEPAQPADPAGEGAPDQDDELPERIRNLWADLNLVRDAFERYDLLDDSVRFLQGPYADTLGDVAADQIALLRIGAGAGRDVELILDRCYDKVPVGGYVVIEDHDAPAVARSVERFRRERGIEEVLERVDWGGVAWRKQEARPSRSAAPPPEGTTHRAPLVTAAPKGACDLTVVVVFYNMKREAERTLYSLTPTYQEGVEDLDYEVVVVENGSDPDQRLGERFVRSFGPRFRYLDMGDDATPSPVPALNRGIAAGRGTSYALMIDGAHVLTPGVLRYGMDGLRTYEPAIVATQQWYTGPGQQNDAMLGGYDQDAEDKLFARIQWPADGYRLFDIGHFIGERDWLDGLWESNCLFAPRRLLRQVGAFDESFDMPGGGYANLELYERLGSSPGVRVVTMLGEGSFHQVHGGTTTNAAEVDERRSRITSYAEHFEGMRGRGFRGHQKPIHYVGSMWQDICRTRARRRVAPNLFVPNDPSDPDGIPATAAPIPQELRAEFTEAYWRTLAWRQTSWLGRRLTKTPGDLWAYQELLADLRPDWIVETGTFGGGRALFLASICELLGHGQILSIDEFEYDQLPQHPRITYLTARPQAATTVGQVRDLVGDDPNLLLILGTRRHRMPMVEEFRAYEPLVPVGSYVIVEDTIVNGHPVWASFGPGPSEAVRQILGDHRDFVADPLLERYPPSFNPGGFLRRVARG